MTIEKMKQLKENYMQVNQRIQEYKAREKILLEERNKLIIKYGCSSTGQVEELYNIKKLEVEKISGDVEKFLSVSMEKLKELDGLLIT